MGAHGFTCGGFGPAASVYDHARPNLEASLRITPILANNSHMFGDKPLHCPHILRSLLDPRSVVVRTPQTPESSADRKAGPCVSQPPPAQRLQKALRPTRPTFCDARDGLNRRGGGQTACGKSNLARLALRWVMGRESADRGCREAAGWRDRDLCRRRPRAARATSAEVVLTNLDNSQRLAPAGFKTTRIRSGHHPPASPAGRGQRLQAQRQGRARAPTCSCCLPMPRPGRIPPRWSGKGQISELINAKAQGASPRAGGAAGHFGPLPEPANEGLN